MEGPIARAYGEWVSIPLTLRMPSPRNDRPLTVGLLLAPPGADRPDSEDPAIARMLGPARVPASEVPASEVPASEVPESEIPASGDARLFADLDVDPALLPAPAAAPIRYLMDCAAADLEEALELTAPAPLALFIEPDAQHRLADSVALAVDAGRSVGLVAGRTDEEIADFLAVVTHSMNGFLLRAADADDAARLLAATVASMRGDDVRAMLSAPDLTGLLALNDEAAATVREILLGIEVADPVGVARGLLAKGLGKAG